MAKGAQADRDHEKKAFQPEKEGLLHDLKQARANEVEASRKIVELEDQGREDVSLFKPVKYEQSYRNRAQRKSLRYPLEDDVVEGDQVDFMPMVSIVLPPFVSPETIVESSWISPVNGAIATPLVEPAAETVN